MRVLAEVGVEAVQYTQVLTFDTGCGFFCDAHFADRAMKRCAELFTGGHLFGFAALRCSQADFMRTVVDATRARLTGSVSGDEYFATGPAAPVNLVLPPPPRSLCSCNMTTSTSCLTFVTAKPTPTPTSTSS